MNFRRVSWAALVAVLVIEITGCASANHAAPQANQPAKTSSTPASPTPSTTAPAPAAPGSTPSPLAPAPPASVVVIPNQYLADPALTNVIYGVELPSNGAPQQYAEGTPILEGSQVVAYRVAPGDIFDFICYRFHLSNDGYILAVNQVRRGSAPLFAGDVLNLSAYTMHKYGGVNGKVLDNPDPSPMPAQKP